VLHLQEAAAAAVQELPARELQALLPPPRLGERPRRNREVAVLEPEPFEPEPWRDPDGLPF
jgi:hypothetical protein